jgi:phage head maturation protease
MSRKTNPTKATETNPLQNNRNIGQRDCREASIRKVESDADGRTFELSFSSEVPYDRWFGPEILDHADGCVDLSRLQEIGVVLFNHNRDDACGKVVRAWVEDGKGKAIIQFDDDNDIGDRICKKVSSGTLRGVSVGYTVSEWESVKPGKQSEDGRFTGPCEIARKWTPLEISIVTVPADATVGVGRDFNEGEPQQETAAKRSGFAYFASRLTANKNF